MHQRIPLPSSFETLIDELFVRENEHVDAPRPNRFTIDSLEAAWALAANSRGRSPERERRPKNPYSSDDDANLDAETLLDPNKILLELGLDSNFSETDIAILRREFALRNHPDRVRDDLRDLATQRMMIANDLMDRYVAKLRAGSR
ncbi:MAG: molecular chaperone DnaJ [Proteobacteria bacterium]|nr:molecular chaperone DnaJ [Pseudomonadota bacterium]